LSCRLGWPQTGDSPASASWMLWLLALTTTLGVNSDCFLFFFCFEALGFELRAYTFCHSANTF
jgi:hypothetical protein